MDMYENPEMPEVSPAFPVRPDPVRRIRRPFSRMGWALLTAGALGLGASVIFSTLAMMLGGPGIYDNSFLMWLVSFFPVYGIGLPVGMLIMKGIPRERYVPKDLKFSHLCILMLLCIPITMAGSIIGSLLASMLSFGQAVDPVADLTMALDPMSIFTMVILAPVMEELLFR